MQFHHHDEKCKLFTSQSSTTSQSYNTSFRRANTSGIILSKAQSTIFICVLLLFITLVHFTLSTFEPSFPSSAPHALNRRFLSHKRPPIQIRVNPTPKARTHDWFRELWKPNSYYLKKIVHSPSVFALQRMGTLFRRGTRAMNDLVVSHIVEDVTEEEFRLFLRVIHRSGLASRADIAFIFPSPSFSSRFASIIQEENDSFMKLVSFFEDSNFSNQTGDKPSFNATLYFKVGEKEKQKEREDPLWGKRNRSSFGNPEAVGKIEFNESTRLRYGSVLGFDSTELDPENSLAGFLGNVPMSLRRWACYPMLLGRVRRNSKQIMLVDAKNIGGVSDPMKRVRSQNPESVTIFKHNSDKTRIHNSVNPAILMGGTRGIRRFTNVMLTEIVREAMQHKKKKNWVTESWVMSQLVCNEFLRKNVNLITSAELIPETISLRNTDAPNSQVYN